MVSRLRLLAAPLVLCVVPAAAERKTGSEVVLVAPVVVARTTAVAVEAPVLVVARTTAVAVEGPVIPLGFSDVVVFATNSIHVKNDSHVLSGDVVANDAVSGPVLASGAELTIGPRSTTAGSLEGDTVRIRAKTDVGGDVHYNHLFNQGTIGGALVTPLSLPVFAQLPPFEAGAPGGADVIVPDKGTLTLAAGDYGLLSVGHSATVFFTGGAYSFTSIAAGPEAALLFDAPAQVRVSGRFATDPDSTIGSSPEGKVPASEIVFYVAGINGSTGALGAEPAAARMGPRNQVAANFYVPNGTLQLQQGTQAEGAFVGRDVEAGPHATLALDSAFFNRPPVAVDDSATVAVGGTVTLLDSGAASVLANDSDPENATLSAALVTGPSHGTLVLNADGTFAYSHDGSESFSDSFVYEACDEGQPVLCDTASVSFTIFVPTKRVTIVKVGSGGGYVSSVPAGIDCGPTCSATFLATETVFLDAVPDAGSVFGSWGGDAECADGVIDGPGDVTCIAPFDLPGQVTLTVQRAGTGTGFVSSDPAGISCGLDCSASFPRLTRIDLFAAADTGSFFVGWSGDPDCEDGFVSADVAKTCVATFDLSPPPPTSFTLTIVTQGTGQGTVTSNPFGIVCGADCVRSFPDGTLVTLFAREDSDAVFAGWGGDCSGLTFSTSVTLDADKTCTATFNLAF